VGRAMRAIIVDWRTRADSLPKYGTEAAERLTTAVLPHYGAKRHSRIVLMGNGGMREVHASAKHADHQEDALEQGGKGHPHLTFFHAHLRALS
jgi:hypothetical protein